MNTNRPVFYARSFICGAALAACAALASPVQAGLTRSGSKFPSTPRASISASRLGRARHTAEFSEPPAPLARRRPRGPGASDQLHGCYEKALGDTIRSAHQSQISIVYLEHTHARDAATYSIDVPVRMAAE